MSPWVPVLLISLALLTLIGGLGVGDFYWNDLRPDVGRIGANLAQVRDRQRAMMGSFAEAQALLLERQRHLLAQSQDLRRREQAVYEARLEIDAQRMQLAQGPVTESRRLSDADRGRAVAAANLAETAAAGLDRDDTLDAARAALSLAESVLASLPGPRGDPTRSALAGAQARLAGVRPVDRAALAEHLEAVRVQAVSLPPVAAGLLRHDGQTGGAEARAGQGETDPEALAAGSLDDQLEAARLALDAADAKGFGLALQGIDRWLGAFYDAQDGPTRPPIGGDGARGQVPDQVSTQVRGQIRELARTPIAAEVAPLAAALAELAAALRAATSREWEK
jgi:uncharacterized protein HemX